MHEKLHVMSKPTMSYADSVNDLVMREQDFGRERETPPPPVIII